MNYEEIYFIFGKLSENNSQKYEANVFTKCTYWQKDIYESHYNAKKTFRVLDLANYNMVKNKKFWTSRYNMSGQKALWIV